MADETTNSTEQVPEQLKAAMAANGVKKPEYAKTLSRVLGISIPQAYKKLNGSNAMTLAQVEAFSAHFDIHILVEERPSPNARDAIFVANQLELPCVINLGSRGPQQNYSKRYAAYHAEGTWYVCDIAGCPPEAELREVEKITLKQTLSIAVLDDDRGTADNHRDFLATKGYLASAFYDSATVMNAILESRFDGYFLDWRLADETSEDLIKFIRKTQPNVPIVVSTASGADGLEQQSALMNLATRYNLSCVKKPMSMKLLTSIMAEAIAQGKR